MNRLIALAPLCAILGFSVVGCAQSPQLSSQPPNNVWLADAETGCKFAVKWLKPSGSEGGSWRFESAQTAKWAGACVDGYASGVGMAIVSIRPVMPNIDPKSGMSFPDPSYAHQPPYENLFYGNFEAGQPNGGFVIRYSNGLSAVATFERGVMKGDPVVHLNGGRIEWFTLPIATLEQAVTREFSPRETSPRPIDPRQGADATFGKARSSPKAERLLDVSNYSDRAAFKAALDQAFPRYAPAPELLEHLIGMSDRNLGNLYFDSNISASCKHTISLAIYPQSAWHCIYTVVKHANTKNREKWIYAAVFADDATLLYYELNRYLSPEDFASRGVPLRVENFLLTKDFLSAALQLLGATPTMDQVARLMESAGMKLREDRSMSRPAPQTQGTGSPKTPQGATAPPATLRAHYLDGQSEEREKIGDGVGRVFSVMLTGCSWAAGLTFEFDPNAKTVLKAEVADSQGCL